jgi:hypothetical protein
MGRKRVHTHTDTQSSQTHKHKHTHKHTHSRTHSLTLTLTHTHARARSHTRTCGRYKIPRFLSVLGAPGNAADFPMTLSGKVQKYKLRRMAHAAVKVWTEPVLTPFTIVGRSTLGGGGAGACGGRARVPGTVYWGIITYVLTELCTRATCRAKAPSTGWFSRTGLLESPAASPATTCRPASTMQVLRTSTLQGIRAKPPILALRPRANI